MSCWVGLRVIAHVCGARPITNYTIHADVVSTDRAIGGAAGEDL